MPKCTRFMLGTREGGGWHRRTLAGLASDGTCARKNAQGKLANFLSGTLLGLCWDSGARTGAALGVEIAAMATCAWTKHSDARRPEAENPEATADVAVLDLAANVRWFKTIKHRFEAGTLRQQ